MVQHELITSHIHHLHRAVLRQPQQCELTIARHLQAAQELLLLLLDAGLGHV